MGASHGTLSSAGSGAEDAPELFLENEINERYDIDEHLFPGSGRMMRTYRLRDKETSSCTAVMKCMWVSKEHEALVEQQLHELRRIKEALKDQEQYVAPFLYWTVGSYSQKSNNVVVRPIALVRAHIYTTLSDRLASRPFLTHIEKLWIVCQLLEALDHLHAKGIVHGFLTTENIGLTSWNRLVLIDVASYKARTALPDDDPSQYLYYFQELYSSTTDGTTTTPREKRCYLAPERFYTPNRMDQNIAQYEGQEEPPLATSMDIFSAGCIIMETFLNGERALDLGDLMEYRKQQSSPQLQQKLNKIEFSAIRAAIRHMLSVDPQQRLRASAYLERLKAASDFVPEESFQEIKELMDRVTDCAPDARLAVAAASYGSILWKTQGVSEEEDKVFIDTILGPTMPSFEKRNHVTTIQPNSPPAGEEILHHEKRKLPEPQNKIVDDLFAETEALLKRLESLNFHDDDDDMPSSSSHGQEATSIVDSYAQNQMRSVKRSQMSQSSLLIYLGLILSTVRHVLRPASKLVALQLIQRVGKYTTDEARLQRIVPVTVSLLQDQDPLVRASAIQVLTSTISSITSFPPSDSKVFPQYIFKRVAHMSTDPALVARLAFVKSVALLAETSHRFLDISYAVRLYEAVGGGGGTKTNSSSIGAFESSEASKNVFTDDVAKLLDDPFCTCEVQGRESSNRKNLNATEPPGVDSTGSSSTENQGIVGNGRTLISSNYHSELAGLHETVSRWVVHITSDSSPAKRALLNDLARLCSFFGLDGVMAFILPQILSFLNDRKDWQLRAALFENLPSLCHFIGRAATEHFVLPCLETALVDSEEAVISSALQCLSELLRMGLLSRSLYLGGSSAEPSLLQKYVPMLVHPSADIRLNFVAIVNEVCLFLGNPDGEVFVAPILRPFLRFYPSSKHLTFPKGLEMCLHSPWTRKRFQAELDKQRDSSLSPTSGQWTAIAFQIHDDDEKTKQRIDSNSRTSQGNSEGAEEKVDIVDSQSDQVRGYLQMIAKRRSIHTKNEPNYRQAENELSSAIEGSLKLGQQIKFPRQVTEIPTLPSWYSTLRETQEESISDDSKEEVTKNEKYSSNIPATESSAIRSVKTLGQIYGLSIMEQSAIASSASGADNSMTKDRAISILQSEESRRMQAACNGEWGSETCLDPTLTDTSLLVTKLNALLVPTLSSQLANHAKRGVVPLKASPRGAGSGAAADWKPKIDTMVATSRCLPEFGHTAPIARLVVSNDQRFFVTGSYDSTCRVWELEKAEHSNGVLESSITYNGHSIEGGGGTRINDLSMVEGGHSVISGASDGSVHVWRVDMVSASSQSQTGSSSPYNAREMARVAGSSIIRNVQVDEGEILAVNHFNTSAASIIAYATQMGTIHSWDIRCAKEPFVLKNPLDTGYITSMAMGSDRNWMVTGSSKGYIALWDIRFQQILSLWRHNRKSPVKRLATSFVPTPHSWAGKHPSTSDARPFVFAACGQNECSMLDLTNGSCRACFRTIDYGHRYSRSDLQDVPRLNEVPLSNTARRRGFAFHSQSEQSQLKDLLISSCLSVNAMVGSIGASDRSFLITGGSDCKMRFWDFAVPSKCYNIGCIDGVQPRFSFDRIGPNQSCRLMLCRQPPNVPPTNEVESSKVPRKLLQGLTRPEVSHKDSIQDLKVVKSGLLSCSRDGTVKLWR